MKYLADLLTLSRFVLSAILLVLAFFENSSLAPGFFIFIVAELTDAFDGTCATKFPFPKDKTPKYRKYAAQYDMVTDVFLLVAMFLFFTLKVNLVAGLTLGLAILISATIVELIIYGKLFGHPDNATKNSLSQKNFNLAKKIVLIRRNFYLAAIAVVATWTLYASELDLVPKIVITTLAALIAIFLWTFLAERRHHISRDAVELEKKLSKKSY